MPFLLKLVSVQYITVLTSCSTHWVEYVHMFNVYTAPYKSKQTVEEAPFQMRHNRGEHYTLGLGPSIS